MGNHQAGQAMVVVAVAIAKRRRPEETALSILDEACEEYRGCDAEFDDYANPDEPFGQLLKEAFAPDEDLGDPMENDDDWDRWYEKVERPFRERYDFC